MRLKSIVTGVAALAAVLTLAAPSHAQRRSVVWALMKDGRTLEGELDVSTLRAKVDGAERSIAVRDLLSFNSAEPASAREQEQIKTGLETLAGKDHNAQEMAVAEIAQIGLPAMSPVLAAYKDTDLHEPNPLYRLFGRIVPGHADALDRGQDLFRLANGDALRGKLNPEGVMIKPLDNATTRVPLSSVRRFAVRRAVIDRTFDVDALRHCTQIEFLDTGVGLSAASHMEEAAKGWVRLSFDMDGWSSDPDGLKVPGPNYKTNLVDGFPFGALVGKVGAAGKRWQAGKQYAGDGLGAGRLYLAVNDNGHWQNNIGSFRVKLHVTNAYDLGDPQ